jgi:deoxycytidine triphosphate deaminase
MGLKSDTWIRKMALEQGMIEPFVDGQVREGVISYGLSSYGYDIRVTNQFKIFTNVHSAIVDPKHFNPNSFVDFEGDICVIPPNSFVLSRTIEYFRIPRNVLTLCIGKSTYARCFRGDTRVALVDGSAPTLEEMAERAAEGELFWGYSIGENGRMIVSLLDNPRYVGQDALVEVVLDEGQSIFCTPDHQFMMRDGRWKEAGYLRPGDSLMPLYRKIARGYEMAYQPINGHFYPTHRMADEWNLRHNIYSDLPDTHRHHMDFDRRNNNPCNIERMDAKDHIRLHNQETFGEEFDPDEHSAAIREAFERLAQDPDWVLRFSEAQRYRAVQFWEDAKYEEIRARVIEQRRNPSDATRQAHRDAMVKRYDDPLERILQGERMRKVWANDDGLRRQQQAEIARQIKLRPEITAEVVREALDRSGSIRGAAKLLNCDRSVFRRFPEVIQAFRGAGKGDNHKVSAVRAVPGVHDVYCLTVPEAGNFALEAGVFVHNCGLIVNVTPFEPMWEGYVTLEISNTTPLPARIYANEGIAQVLFFEGDEPCEVSYADRKGKYQGQQTIVLPRI